MPISVDAERVEGYQAACRCHCSNKEDHHMLNFHYDTEMETTHDE